LSSQETNYKTEELAKYHALVLAAIDYDIALCRNAPIQAFNPIPNLEKLKQQAEEHFVKGRLATLKRWYHDLTEGIREGRAFNFNSFVKEHTGYTIDIFKVHFNKVESLVAKGRITTDNQFYDVHSMVDYLSQIQPVDEKKIAVLNNLLVAYQQQKTKRLNARTA
jgi:DNA-binding SARP family transcriptional activator